MEGFGTFEYKSGEIYIGQFTMGLMQGYGINRRPDGD